MKHKITVYHYYKGEESETIIIINGDYSIRYALFMALIDSHVKFNVEILKDSKKEE